MNGVSQAMRALGVLMVTGIGGVLSKNDVNAPFILVGIFDFILVVVCVLMLLKGFLKE